MRQLKKRSNVHLVDWYKASAGHPEYFAYDGIHLEYAGSKALTDLIVKRWKHMLQIRNNLMH